MGQTHSLPNKGRNALFNNSRYLADVTIPDGSVMTAGETFVKTWRVENTGGRAWSDGYRLVFVDGEAMTEQPSKPLPLAAPGQQVDVSLSLAVPNVPGYTIGRWRMQDEEGRSFGDLLFLEINVVPQVAAAWPFDAAAWRDTIWAITSVFESGRPQGDPAAYQTFDAGIISYGKHQATLGSGTLGQVLHAYWRRSDSPASQALRQEYAARLERQEVALRNDTRLRALLQQAAAEPEMVEAQDEVFDQRFYQPAVVQAQRHNVTSPLGLTCLYDTNIQGGLFLLLPVVVEKVGGIVAETGSGGRIDEAAWLGAFLDEREARLLRLAEQSEAAGNRLNAEALRISTFRVAELRKLLEGGNLGLQGQLTVQGQRIPGIKLPERSQRTRREESRRQTRRSGRSPR